MKISILAHSCLPFHDGTLAFSPLGGTETGAIHFARQLKYAGHDVLVFTNINNQIGNYHPIRDISQYAVDSDIIISVRDYKACSVFPNVKLRMFWTGDSYDQPFNVGMGDKRAARNIDLFLAVSEWHKQTLCEASGFPLEKSWVIRNGINLSLFQDNTIQKNRKRLIYSSMPYRGFVFTPELYSRLLQIHPDIEFHAFTGFGVVNNLKNDQQIQELEYALEKLRPMPGFHYHGNVKQDQLAKEFLKSGILFYPNTFEETSCITAIEAMAAGCVPITSSFGALPETINGTGYLIPGAVNSPNYQYMFVEKCSELIKDENLFNQMSESAKRHASTYDWKLVTQNFLNEVKTRFNVY